MARSGWVEPEGPERLSDDVSLGVLAKVFPPSLVEKAITTTGAGEQRSRLLPSWMMVYYVMSLALHASASYEEVMRSLLGGLQWITHQARQWSMPTKAAIFKARIRLGSEVMIELFEQAAKPFGQPSHRGFLSGLRLVSIDGTTMDIADTPANEQAYGRPGTNTGFKSAFPQARILGLVECGTHAIIGAVTGPYALAENTLYPALHHKLDASMLLMADRGFFSYQSFKDSAASGAHLLWRVKNNMVLPVHQELGDGSYLSAVFEVTKQRRNNVDPVPVRVVEYRVTDGQKSSDFRLVTTLLDPGRVSAEELAEAYAQRWEIELCFKEMKTHQRGPSVVLRSKTPDGVLQEIYWYLCTHYALRTLIGEVAMEFDEDPLRISFTRTLRAARRSMTAQPDFSP